MQMLQEPNSFITLGFVQEPGEQLLPPRRLSFSGEQLAYWDMEIRGADQSAPPLDELLIRLSEDSRPAKRSCEYRRFSPTVIKISSSRVPASPAGSAHHLTESAHLD